MGEPLKFDYYYGVEAEQFSFYRVDQIPTVHLGLPLPLWRSAASAPSAAR